MKGVQLYEHFVGIALKNQAYVTFRFIHCCVIWALAKTKEKDINCFNRKFYDKYFSCFLNIITDSDIYI